MSLRVAAHNLWQKLSLGSVSAKFFSEPPTVDTVYKLIGALFSQRPGDIRSINNGSVSRVFIVHMPKGKDLIVKINRESEFKEYLKEKWCMERIAKIGLPVPKIHTVGKDIIPFAYSIQQRIDGIPANQFHGDRQKIWRQIGKCAAAINFLPTGGYGRWMGDFSSGQWACRTWGEYIQPMIDRIFHSRSFWIEEFVAQENLKNMRFIFEKMKDWKFSPTLCHGNFAMSNILVDSLGDITGILDWGNAASHRAPYYELATAFFWMNREEQESFLMGYGLNWSQYEDIKNDVEALQLLEMLDLARWSTEHDNENQKNLEKIRKQLKPLILRLGEQIFAHRRYPSVRGKIRDVIQAAIDTPHSSLTYLENNRTSNRYQSVQLDEDWIKGYRTSRADILDKIPFKGKKVLDLGSNLGELSRGARRRGALFVDGFEYDPFFIETANLINAYLGATRVSFYKRDITDPGVYAEKYDLVLAFAVFDYIKKILPEISRITSEMLVLETHVLKNDLDKSYLDRLSPHFKYRQLIGYVPENADGGSGKRAVLAFANNRKRLSELNL
ncbi:MAG: phosphotransferase [Elusimicrobia bacterium]|nr:phosphotransferase [Elusimicrobiota bacterium]